MNEEKLKTWVKANAEYGPTRVVINQSGEATTPEAAERDYSVKPTIIYIRDDGWSLGTPPEFDTVARKMWDDKWVAAMWYRAAARAWYWRPWGSGEEAQEVK